NLRHDGMGLAETEAMGTNPYDRSGRTRRGFSAVWIAGKPGAFQLLQFPLGGGLACDRSPDHLVFADRGRKGCVCRSHNQIRNRVEKERLKESGGGRNGDDKPAIFYLQITRSAPTPPGGIWKALPQSFPN